MRRLLLAATLAAASFATPALATHDCEVQVNREVRVGDAEFGVCAGATPCPHECEPVVQVTCEGPAPVVRYCAVLAFNS